MYVTPINVLRIVINSVNNSHIEDLMRHSYSEQSLMKVTLFFFPINFFYNKRSTQVIDMKVPASRFTLKISSFRCNIKYTLLTFNMYILNTALCVALRLGKLGQSLPDIPSEDRRYRGRIRIKLNHSKADLLNDFGTTVVPFR